MAAGGTGGHIYPALAVAEELWRRAALTDRRQIEFLGTQRGLEERLIPGRGFAVRTVRAAGLKGISGWRRWLNLLVLPQSVIETAVVLREFRPHVVMGIGGYLAGPAMLEAALMNIPTLLFEPNAVPGFTNRVLGPVVRMAAVGFEETASYYGSKARVTGHPVRRAFYEIPPKAHAAPWTVLVIGGSQGSRALNDCMAKSLPLLCSALKGAGVIHQTGERDYNAVEEAYRRQGLDAEVHPFIDDMPGAFARADLVISRAGAMTVAELAAAGKAAILVPFPAATGQHQLENARAVERAGAALVIEQKDLTSERLVRAVCDLLGDPQRLQRMGRCAKGLARPDAARQIADLIEQLAVNR